MAERRAWAAWSEWGDLALDALREIRAHKLRSVLTLFGIVFGVASVVSMTSLSSALEDMAYDELQRMGMPRTFRLIDRGPRSDVSRAEELRHVGLSLGDIDALTRLRGVAATFGRNFAGRQLASTELDQRVIPIVGVDAAYLRFRNWPIVRGRELAPLDIMNASRVAVIGEELVKPFFGSAEPIGRTIQLDGIRFRVIGVVAPLRADIVQRQEQRPDSADGASLPKAS